jgi:hypothetical protein
MAWLAVIVAELFFAHLCNKGHRHLRQPASCFAGSENFLGLAGRFLCFSFVLDHQMEKKTAFFGFRIFIKNF